MIQGIEDDSRGKRIACGLFREHPGGFVKLSSYSAVSERVSADEILHSYKCDRPGQVRGVSWLAPVLIALKDLGDFEDAQLLKQKLSACYAVFIRYMDAGFDPLKLQAHAEVEKLEPGLVQKTYHSPRPLL